MRLQAAFLPAILAAGALDTASASAWSVVEHLLTGGATVAERSTAARRARFVGGERVRRHQQNDSFEVRRRVTARQEKLI